MVEAGHPIPDAAGLRPPRARCSLRGRGRDDLVLVLCPAALGQLDRAGDGVTLEDKQAITRALLRSGANIREINAVRKRLSRIKGGRLRGPPIPPAS